MGQTLLPYQPNQEGLGLSPPRQLCWVQTLLLSTLSLDSNHVLYINRAPGHNKQLYMNRTRTLHILASSSWTLYILGSAFPRLHTLGPSSSWVSDPPKRV